MNNVKICFILQVSSKWCKLELVLYKALLIGMTFIMQIQNYKSLCSIMLFINTAINNFLFLFLELESKLLTPTTK